MTHTKIDWLLIMYHDFKAKEINLLNFKPQTSTKYLNKKKSDVHTLVPLLREDLNHLFIGGNLIIPARLNVGIIILIA